MIGSLKPHVRTTVMNSVSFALPLHRNNDGFQSCMDADVVMREPEVWEAKIAIGPVPGSPEQNGLRNRYCGNQLSINSAPNADAILLAQSAPNQGLTSFIVTNVVA